MQAVVRSIQKSKQESKAVNTLALPLFRNKYEPTILNNKHIITKKLKVWHFNF